ncbi:hypothetical protein V8C43DRAFT_82478 [Trichoderma afarasin]
MIWAMGTCGIWMKLGGFHFFGCLCFLLHFNSFKIGFMYLYATPLNHDQSCCILTRIFLPYLFSLLLLAEPKIRRACIKHIVMSPTLPLLPCIRSTHHGNCLSRHALSYITLSYNKIKTVSISKSTISRKLPFRCIVIKLDL